MLLVIKVSVTQSKDPDHADDIDDHMMHRNDNACLSACHALLPRCSFGTIP
jgi:hypothetical protein